MADRGGKAAANGWKLTQESSNYPPDGPPPVVHLPRQSLDRWRMWTMKLATAAAPIAVQNDEVALIIGLDRAPLYQEEANKRLRIRKAGTRTFILLKALSGRTDALPTPADE